MKTTHYILRKKNTDSDFVLGTLADSSDATWKAHHQICTIHLKLSDCVIIKLEENLECVEIEIEVRNVLG